MKVYFCVCGTQNFQTEPLSLKIHESEGNKPFADIFLTTDLKKYLNLGDFCYLETSEKKVLFYGNIEKISVENESLSIVLSKNTPIETTSEQPSNELGNDIEDLFYDSADFVEKKALLGLKTLYYDKASDFSDEISVVSSENTIDLSDSILKDTLKLSVDKSSEIKELQLEIDASWVSRCEGETDISTKIANKFPKGCIETITPKSLESAWPGFGDRITNINSKSAKSRYFVGKSRLSKDTDSYDASKLVVFKINDEIPEIRVRKEKYNGILSVCFGFDQYRKETLKAVIKNPLSLRGVQKKIKINLGNVYEYLDSVYDESFFATRQGKKAVDHAFEMIGSYISFSMRNTTISFCVPFNEKTCFINCSNHISVDILGIGNIRAKITEITFDLKNVSNKLINITAKSFDKNVYEKLLSSGKKQISYGEFCCFDDKRLSEKDIIFDIVVKNDANSQLKKLSSYIKSLFNSRKINKYNYKQEINKFLSNNKTEITIVTKPLKTEHCIKNVLEFKEECTFLD